MTYILSTYLGVTIFFVEHPCICSLLSLFLRFLWSVSALLYCYETCSSKMIQKSVNKYVVLFSVHSDNRYLFWPEVFLTSLSTLDPCVQRIFNSNRNKTYKEREESMDAHDIIGDVIECTPRFQLWVEYPRENIVDFGNIINPRACSSTPSVVHWPVQKDVYYILSLVGADYPSRERRTEYTEWNHWLIVNIQGNNWADGEVLAEYIGPHLLKGKGFHRYVFLVYQQPTGKMKFDEPRLNKTYGKKIRRNFCIREFAVKYDLESPIAGNWFFTP
ncbi:OV-16 antigen isoform X1 [Bemisia tabaci]|uniref:OV-16 antigen isoform X1 n=1 Tax=Bemisia tabaci TaxID=7038 RepID=UPI003B27C34D